MRAVIHRIEKSLKQDGLRTTLLKMYGLVVDRSFDMRYGTDTCASVVLKDLTIHSDNRDRGFHYQPARVMPLRRLFGHLKSLVDPESILVDFGCGKGRVLLVASEFGFREVRGVEFAHELCEIARRNCAAYRRATGTDTLFRIIESDAATYAVHTDENVFFLFNPFDRSVLSRVLDHITSSVRARPRRVWVIYCNPRFYDATEDQTGLAKVMDLRFWGSRFEVYSNTADVGALVGG